MLPAAAAAVLSPDEQQARLEITAATPSDPAVARAGQRTLSPRSCMAIRLGRAHDRTPDDENLLRCDVCGATAGTSACEPLLVGGQTIGSVLVTAPKPLSPECRERFRETVAQAAPILANQRNLALARSLARSDALTGLANRRAADEMLERLSAQSARSRTPLAAVLMDLDNLKQINDRHGHAAGDRALALIGATIAASLRETDFAARIGGDEFVLLLPDTGRDGARTAAEKLRAAVAAVQAGDIGQISASLGVAIMPDDATDAESLLREADAALYAAKEQGRNCIAVYTPDDEFPRHSQRRPHVDSRPGEAPAWENALS
jgi:diguanylate cyclase